MRPSWPSRRRSHTSESRALRASSRELSGSSQLSSARHRWRAPRLPRAGRPPARLPAGPPAWPAVAAAPACHCCPPSPRRPRRGTPPRRALRYARSWLPPFSFALRGIRRRPAPWAALLVMAGRLGLALAPALADAAPGVFGVDRGRQVSATQAARQECVHGGSEVLLRRSGFHGIHLVPHDLLGVFGRHVPPPERIEHTPDRARRDPCLATFFDGLR